MTVDDAMEELRDNFYFTSSHEKRVKKLLQNDESLLTDLSHLVIAASLVLSDASQMEDGDIRAYEMGDKIIIEEKDDPGWSTVRTIGIQIAQVLAHARAKERVEEIEEKFDDLGNERRRSSDDFFDKIKEDPPSNPIPTGRPPQPGPYDTYFDERGTEGEVKIRDLDFGISLDDCKEPIEKISEEKD